MGGGGPNKATDGSGQNQPVHPPHHHRHTPPGPSTHPPLTIEQHQPAEFHPIQLVLKPDNNNNYFLQPITRDIPSFPSKLPPGARICLGLKSGNDAPVAYQHGMNVDNTLIYVSVYVSNDNVEDTVLGSKRKGYKVGLIISAGGGVFQLGPVYSILSREANGLTSLAITVTSPALNGRANVTFKGASGNTMTIDAVFEGNGGLWKGVVGNSYTLN